jgi:hypothetical protein
MEASFKTEIQLTDSDGAAVELANVSIDAVLYMQGRERYRFYVGKTDMHGRLPVSFDSLEKLRLDNQAFSIMDYNTKLQECDSRVSFVVPSMLELRQRQAAMEKWFPEEAQKSESADNSNNGTLSCTTADIDSGEGTAQVFLACERCG